MTDPLRALIIARLNNVTGIGQVHSYQRYAAREKALSDLYVSDGQLRGWFVRRVSVVEKNHSAVLNVEESRWLIRGYMALDDANASELAFDDLLDAIRVVFRAKWSDFSLKIIDKPQNGEVVGLSIDEALPVMFSGVLCHSVKCSLVIKRLVSYDANSF